LERPGGGIDICLPSSLGEFLTVMTQREAFCDGGKGGKKGRNLLRAGEEILKDAWNKKIGSYASSREAGLYHPQVEGEKSILQDREKKKRSQWVSKTKRPEGGDARVRRKGLEQ